MKFRNLLMTAVFLIAVGSSFAFKTKTRFFFDAMVDISGFCQGVQALTACRTAYTGPQCTYYASGANRGLYEYPIPAGPICVTPLRQYKP